MKLLFNPPTGKPIGAGHNDFVFEGERIEAHLPGEVKQYEDRKANELLEIFAFLAEVSPVEAKKIVEKPRDKEFKCKYCDFSTDTKLALSGHMRKHKDEIAKEGLPIIDPNIVPIAGGEKIKGNAVERADFKDEVNTRDGVDRDGVEWYGGGVKEERSFEKVKPDNQGHFGRQKLT